MWSFIKLQEDIIKAHTPALYTFQYGILLKLLVGVSCINIYIFGEKLCSARFLYKKQVLLKSQPLKLEENKTIYSCFY